MSSNKYMLDRIEDGYAVFLKHPDEQEQVLVRVTALNKTLKEGDFVMIEEQGDIYNIEVLEDETKAQEAKIADIMKRLRNRGGK